MNRKWKKKTQNFLEKNCGDDPNNCEDHLGWSMVERWPVLSTDITKWGQAYSSVNWGPYECNVPPEHTLSNHYIMNRRRERLPSWKIDFQDYLSPPEIFFIWSYIVSSMQLPFLRSLFWARTQSSSPWFSTPSPTVPSAKYFFFHSGCLLPLISGFTCL